MIEHSSGKKRVIDDAASGLQSHFSCDAKQLRFCSLLQPCLHLQCLHSALPGPTQQWPGDLVSFGEDLPQAYRKIPLVCEHSWACVVAYFSPEKQAVLSRRYHGLRFGLPLIGFHLFFFAIDDSSDTSTLPYSWSSQQALRPPDLLGPRGVWAYVSLEPGLKALKER